VLRGDEFNSMMENGGRLAKALADGLGVPIGALRSMAEAGELTARKVIDALLSQQAIIDREFSALPQTVDGALTRLSNRFTQYVGESEKVGAASQALIGILNGLADHMDAVADAALTVGKVLVAAVAVKAAAALRNMAAAALAAAGNMKVLAGATVAYGQQAQAAAAMTQRLGGAIKAVGWTAVALELIDVVGNLAELYQQEKLNAALAEDLAAKQDKVRSRLEAVGEQTGKTFAHMEAFNEAVAQGLIHFDQAIGKWQAGTAALEDLSQSIAEFETPTEVQSGFFAQLTKEIGGLTQETFPAFQRKVADLGQANLLSAGHIEALTAMLLEQGRKICGAAEATEKLTGALSDLKAAADAAAKAETYTASAAAALEQAYNEGAITLEEFVSGTQKLVAKNETLVDSQQQASEKVKDVATAEKEASEEGETLHESLSGVASVAAAMRQRVEDLAGSLRELSPEAETAFRSMVSDGQYSTDAVEHLNGAMAETVQELQRLENLSNTGLGNTGFGRFFNETTLAAEKVRLGFRRQAAAAEQIIRQFEGVDSATQAVVDSAAQAADGFDLLDKTRLSALRSEIDRLMRANEDLQRSAQDALRRYQDLVDRQAGNELAIAERERAEALEDLEDQLAAAREAGNVQVLAQLQQALELARQYHDEEIARLRERRVMERAIADQRARPAAPDSGSGSAPGEPPSSRLPSPVNPAQVTIPDDQIQRVFGGMVSALRDVASRPLVVELDGRGMARLATENLGLAAMALGRRGTL
jgi:methyl-accepting chemotaxis protein